jgi:hypothetical protein
MLRCPKCGASLDAASATCASCGASVLDVLVAAKVQDALAQQSADQARKVVEGEKADQRKLYTSLLAANAQVPRGAVAAAPQMFVRWLLVVAFSWLALGVFVHLWAFELIGMSPAGLLCPLHCTGCKGPGRVFTWGYEGSWEEAKGQMGYAFLCSGPGVDAKSVSWLEVSSSRNAELQPFLMNGFFTWFVEGVFVSLGAALLITGLRLPGHEARVERRKVALERKLASLR